MALSADVRRVVTTIDRNDKAVVLFDGATPHKKVRPQTQTVSRLLWVTDQTPADLSGTADRAAIERERGRFAAGRERPNPSARASNLSETGLPPPRCLR